MSLWSALIPAVATVAGSAIGAIANKSSTKSANKAAEKANERRQQGIAQGTEIYGDLKEQSAPAVRYLQDVISNPVGGLYPDQVAGQQESRRQSLNDISKTGLRGSGRAVTASLKAVNSDFLNDALAQNRGTRTNAAGALTGQYFSAGNNTANALISGSDAAARSTEDQGTNTANMGTANAQLVGNTLGDIGSLIAQETKGRDSRYAGLDVPGRSATAGTVNPATGQFGHLAKGGVVRSRLHDVRACA